MNKDLKYDSRSFRIFMPETEVIKTVTLNQLLTATDDAETPVTKVEMPTEHGFFRGVEYTENNTLLKYINNKWVKLTTIVFKEGGKAMFGTDSISKTGRLTKIDSAIRDTVLSAAKLPQVA